MKFLMILSLLPALMAFLKPQHSRLEAKATQDGKALQLEFKVIPNEGMQITVENAPWSLTLKEIDGLNLKDAKEGVFQTKELDEGIPGFRLTTTPAKKSGTVSYELRSFICTKDKSRCYPELHKGDLPWQLK